MQLLTANFTNKTIKVLYENGKTITINKDNTYLLNNMNNPLSKYSSPSINRYYKDGQDKVKYEKLLKFLSSINDDTLRERFILLLKTYPYELTNDLSIYCNKEFYLKDDVLVSPYYRRDIIYKEGDEVTDYRIDENILNHCSYGLNAYTMQSSNPLNSSENNSYFIRTRLKDIKYIDASITTIRTSRYILCNKIKEGMTSSLFYQSDKNIICRKVNILPNEKSKIVEVMPVMDLKKSFNKPYTFTFKAKEDTMINKLLEDFKNTKDPSKILDWIDSLKL